MSGFYGRAWSKDIQYYKDFLVLSGIAPIQQPLNVTVQLYDAPGGQAALAGHSHQHLVLVRELMSLLVGIAFSMSTAMHIGPIEKRVQTMCSLPLA